MKHNLFIFSFFILLVLCSNAIGDDYTIIDNTVYIDDSNIYLSATPHTLSSSGWVYFNLTSKKYTGNIDACWGFNTITSKPTKAELYKPYWINTTIDHQKIFYNSSFVIYTGNNLDYGNSYNTNYKYTVTETINNDNRTVYITSNAAFDSFDTDGTNYTIYWYTRHDNYYLWKDFSPSFTSIIYDYNGFDKWYYIKNISIAACVNYTVRVWVDIPISIEKQTGKYNFAVKPSNEIISNAIINGHFYNLDPWWNTTWNQKKEIILTGGISGVQTDYQLLLNVTYESKMQSDFDDLRFCNETHKLDSWLESKVDNSYALIWVKFPTTPLVGVNQTYYMYYGNTGATSDWDDVATFPTLSDSFEDNDVTDWSGSTIAIESTIVKSGTYSGIASGTTGPYKTGKSRTSDYIIEFDYRQPDTSERYVSIGKDGIYTSNCIFLRMNGGVLYYHDGSYHTIKDPINSDQWYKFKIFVHFTPNTFDIWLDGNSLGVGLGTRGIISEHNDINSVPNGQTEFFDNIFVHKYASNPPTYVFGEEISSIYIPPNPITLTNTTGNYWVNHTWNAGSGNVTDSYNVSINNVWHNTTINTFYNNAYTAHEWQNISIWAYNASGLGSLSLGSIDSNTQIPNNPITITNTFDWTGHVGEIVYVDYNAVDADSDIPIFSCNRTDLFTDFNVSTGNGNWTSTDNIYYVDFGVSDGYGSISNYTMTLKSVSLLDELKLIMLETTSGLKSINMGNYLVYAFILIGILLIILLIRILNNCIYRG